MRGLISFSFVGVLGVLSNLACFYVLDFFNVWYLLNACLCFALAVSQNYILNATFTFKHSLKWRAYLGYVGANLFGLCVNLSILALCQKLLLEPCLELLASIFLELDSSVLRRGVFMCLQAFCIICAFISNFLFAKLLIYKEHQCD
ncbi:GtrA family protein [Helicobacter sp.]|uniref:GtrA family protein n=1 Tax=Helicobacter sp. TaxID=218 RepID=UPI0025C1603A|nr:GtrA family protein [Helicobacter sp.]MBR2494824.1 GtrA family protein [Helicobacter sp.]